MKRLIAVAVFLAACGGNPEKPRIGATQIDRMGRAAVNTALTNPFGLVAGKTTDQSKDEYNAASDPATWTSFVPQIKTHLAILDGIDGNCGNQLAAGSTVDANRYAALAGVLADDRLYVRTDKISCDLYLAVEADAVKLTNGNGDCGGRTPLEDTIKETYSLLVIGAPTGITDGLPTASNGFGSEQDGTPNAATFPFLAAPH